MSLNALCLCLYSVGLGPLALIHISGTEHPGMHSLYRVKLQAVWAGRLARWRNPFDKRDPGTVENVMVAVIE